MMVTLGIVAAAVVVARVRLNMGRDKREGAVRRFRIALVAFLCCSNKLLEIEGIRKHQSYEASELLIIPKPRSLHDSGP